MPRPPGLPPVPRRPVMAALLTGCLAVALWFSVPAGIAVLRLSGWHWESVLAVLGAHVLVVAPIGWIAWLFWAGRRPGDGG